MKGTIQVFLHAARAVAPEFTAEDVLDVLWLASHMGVSAAPQVDPAATPPVHRPAPPASPMAPRRMPLGMDAPSRSPHIPSLSSLSPPPQSTVPTDPEPPLNAADLFLPGQLPEDHVFLAPSAQALPPRRALWRALRPLIRRQPSKRQWVLDEELTVKQMAQAWLCGGEPPPVIPALVPLKERWLRVTLIVDHTPSMDLWRDLAFELFRFLRGQGAFRDVRVFSLTATPQPRLTEGLARAGMARGPLELVDAAGVSGRSVIVVLTDNIASMWRDGQMLRWLHSWTRRAPVALLQVLPESMWPRTALRDTLPVQLRAASACTSNNRLTVASRDVFFSRDDFPAPEETSVLPIVTLDPASMGRWAELVGGRIHRSVPGVIFSHPEEAVSSTDEKNDATPEELAPAQIMERFWLAASQPARALALYLAAVPIFNLPLLRVVRKTMVPQAIAANEAEVLLGGILEQVSESEAGAGSWAGADERQFDFVTGVRDLLLSAVPVLDIHRVLTLEAVSDYMSNNLGEVRNFRAVLARPQTHGKNFVQRGGRFARITADVLVRLGGDFAALARPPLPRTAREPASQTQAAPPSSAPPTPTEPSAEEQLRALDIVIGQYRSQKRWPPLIDALQKRATLTVDLKEKCDLYLQVGQLLFERVQDIAASNRAYEQALTIDPDNPEALARLKTGYERRYEWKNLLKLQQREIANISDPRQKLERCADVARMAWSKALKGDVAIELWLQVLALEPNHTEARSGLERAYSQERRWDRLADLSLRDIERLTDPKKRRAALLRLADTIKLQTASAAPDVRSALYKQLGAVYQSLGKHEQARAALLERRATLLRRKKLSADSAAQVGLLLEICELDDMALGDSAAAIRGYLEVLQLDPANRRAFEFLRDVYRIVPQRAKLLALLRNRLAVETNPDERAALLDELTELTQQQNLADQAQDFLQKALEPPPGDVPVQQTFAKRREHTEKWEMAVASIVRRADSARQARRSEGEFEARLRAARIWTSKLPNAEKAQSMLARALEIRPADTRALMMLARVYEAQRDWTRCKATLERVVPLVQSRPAMTELYSYLGRILGRAGDDQDDTFRQSLEGLAIRRGEYGALAQLFESQLAWTNPARTALHALASRLTELYDKHLEQPECAIAAWQKVLQRQTHDDDMLAWQELERLCAQAQRPAEQVTALEKLVALTPQGPEQKRLLARSAQLHEQPLGNPRRAIAAWRQVLSLDARDAEALAALERLLASTYEADELAAVLEQQAAVATEAAAQADFFFRLGELRLNTQFDLDGAFAVLRKALERHPQHAGARAAVERLIASPAHALPALELLEPLAESERNFDKLLDLLEVRVSVTAGKQERASLFERMAHLAENELRDPSRAFDAVARAFVDMPEDARLAEEMERLAKECGRDSDAATTLEQEWERMAFGRSNDSEKGSRADLQRDLGLRAAQIWERLSDDQRAETRFQTVLDLESGNQTALVALERIYRRRNETILLAEVLLRRAGLELDHGKKKLLLSEAAELYQGPLADEFKAVEAWKKILELDETDGKALGALADLYQRTRRFEELVAIRQTQARASRGATKVQILAHIAELYADELDQPAQAIAVYRELLELQPNSLKALAVLEVLYSRQEQWPLVQEVLQKRLKVVGSIKERVAVLRKLAQLALDKLHSDDDAIAHLQSVLEMQPGDGDAQRDLEQLLEQAEKWYDLIEVLVRYGDAAHKAGRSEDEVTNLLRAAELWESRIQAPEQAKKLLERVLEREPNHVRALLSLARIYESQHDWVRCKATLERAVRLERSGQEMAELYYRLGRMEGERLGEAAAEPYYERALQADPTNVEVAEALEKLARARRDFRRVAALLETRAERMESMDPQKQKDLLLELGRLYVNELKSPDGALPVLQHAYRIAPDELAVIEPLAELYFNSGRLREALPLYRALLERSGKGRRSKDLTRIHFRLGDIAEREGDVHKALEEYSAGYSIDAGHLPTLIALGRLYRAAADWENARRIYRSMLLQNLDPAGGVTRADVYLHLGEIHLQLGEGPKAVGMFERGLELDPEHPRLLAMMRQRRLS